jgi:BMFP domain-containing protein YqiC
VISELTQNLMKEIDRALADSRQTAEAVFSRDQVKPMVEAALKRTGLVTREEFDAQQAVLLRTREKVDALEQQVKLI